MAGNVLLVLPVRSYRAEAFLAAAHRIGLGVALATDRASTVAASPEVVVDLDRPDAAAEAAAAFAARHPVDGVVGVDESAVLPAAAIAARLGLRHHGVEAVAATRDKRRMRRRVAAAGLRQPAFVETATGAARDRLADAAREAGGFPVVVKPVGLAASQGVLRADGAEELEAAARRIGALLDRLGCAPESGAGHPILVEAFLPGREVAVEALVRAGRVDVLRVFDKPDPLDGPTFAETLYVAPSRLPPAVQAAITGLVVAAAAALGLDEGPIHAEVRVDPLTGPALVEVAARSIGGLCSQAVRVCAADPQTLAPVGEAMALEEVILRHAVGLPLPERLVAARGAGGVLMLPVLGAGRLVAVDGVGAARAVEGIDSVSIGMPVGAELEPLPEGDRYLGFVVASADHPLRVETALREAWRRLTARIDPAPVRR